MLLLRPLYETWVLRATEASLAPWQRHLLARALVRDERLRCLAAELAEFSHAEPPESLHPPDLRDRLVRQAAEPRPARTALAWRPSLAAALASLAVALATALAWWGLEPSPPRVELAQVHQPDEAEALRLPTLTPTPTATPTPSPTPQQTDGAPAEDRP